MNRDASWTAFFFLPEQGMAQKTQWTAEQVRGAWVLLIHTIFPDLPDERAEECITRMENTLAAEEGYTYLRGGTGLGDYGFSLVMQEEGSLESYLQISYIGGPWGAGLGTQDDGGAEKPASELLYYNAKGGKYYHATAMGCRAVDPSYFPLASFSSEDLTKAPYSKLQPCMKCFSQP